MDRSPISVINDLISKAINTNNAASMDKLTDFSSWEGVSAKFPEDQNKRFFLMGISRWEDYDGDGEKFFVGD